MPSPNLSPLGSGPIPGGGWSSGGGAGSGGGSDYRLGDDVVHAAFGEGVVVGVEAGGIVVIRFAKDHSERKLVADLAPIEKR
jgi:DNA helicase-2/ATP-dependent DNA helicase PcrA